MLLIKVFSRNFIYFIDFEFILNVKKQRWPKRLCKENKELVYSPFWFFSCLSSKRYRQSYNFDGLIAYKIKPTKIK